MSPLDGERRLTSATSRGPSGPRRTAGRRPLGGGAPAATACTAASGSRSARRPATSRASATARDRKESVEVTAAIVVRRRPWEGTPERGGAGVVVVAPSVGRAHPPEEEAIG